MAGGFFDNADAFDAEDAGEGDAGGVALAGEEFGAVEPECFDADEDLAGLGFGDWSAFESEGFGSAGFVDYCCSHGRGHCCVGERMQCSKKVTLVFEEGHGGLVVDMS